MSSRKRSRDTATEPTEAERPLEHLNDALSDVPSLAHTESDPTPAAHVNEAVRLPDGSGVMFGSMPLPETHWLTRPGMNVPPMPLRLGSAPGVEVRFLPDDNGVPRGQRFTAQELRAHVARAGRYAVRAATMNGKEKDFDPDALVQNLVVALCGYHTGSGFGDDPLFNPGKAGDAARAKAAADENDPTIEAASLEYS